MNVAGAAFCEACGKALPTAAPTGPRVVSADAMPESAGGKRLVTDELVKQQKRASTALLVVGIIQFTCGAILLGILSQAPAAKGQVKPIVWILQFGVGTIFLVLWAWSRKSPLPATIVGLILYVTLVAVNVVTSVSSMSTNPDQPRTGFGGLGIGFLDIIIIAILAQAIGAGLKYKRLLESQGGGA
jgi:hypothetical protein